MIVHLLNIRRYVIQRLNMEQRLNKFKNFLSFSSTFSSSSDQVEPQLGFKVSFNEDTKQLKVKIIGARQLPTIYGNCKPYGYLVKVRVFPGKEKFETKIATESCPTFNEDFIFPIPKQLEYLKGKFVSMTIYAVLENVQEQPKKTKNVLRRFLSFNEYNNDDLNRLSRSRRSFRHSMNSIRTIGTVTYSLEKNIFTQHLGNGYISTPDIWRSAKEITSGIIMEPREGKKGSVEVTLSYAVSEDGRNDVVEVSVTKLRCSMQTMQEHEKLGGQLYIKITAFEYDDLIQKMKSDRFDPTISLKIEQKTATLRATVNNYNIEQVKILIRLLCKNFLGKKILLGKIEMNSKSDIWKEIVQSPSVPITRMMNFE